MENDTLETLLVAQVLTLATALETLNKVKEKRTTTDYEREAALLINRRAPQVLRWLAETKGQ